MTDADYLKLSGLDAGEYHNFNIFYIYRGKFSWVLNIFEESYDFDTFAELCNFIEEQEDLIKLSKEN